MSFHTDLMDDARSFVSAQFGGIDMKDMAEDAIRNAVEKLYHGGWQDFEAAFRRAMSVTSDPIKVEEWSPLKVRIKFNRIATTYRYARRLGMHDEVESFSITDTDMKFVISRARVDVKSRRDVITARTIELHSFTRAADSHLWSHDMVDMTTEVHEEVVRFGSVMTPERYAAIMDQYETCYRPGTEKAPMAGYIARAEVSWQQMHADDTFQTPSK